MGVGYLSAGSNEPNAIFDGRCLAEHTGWNDLDNVFWSGADTMLEIELREYSCITGVAILADCNDHYQIYVDGVLIVEASPDDGCPGLSMWPSTMNRLQAYPECNFKTFAAVPIACGRSVTVQARGDDNYAVSEIQLRGFWPRSRCLHMFT